MQSENPRLQCGPAQFPFHRTAQFSRQPWQSQRQLYCTGRIRVRSTLSSGSILCRLASRPNVFGILGCPKDGRRTVGTPRPSVSIPGWIGTLMFPSERSTAADGTTLKGAKSITANKRQTILRITTPRESLGYSLLVSEAFPSNQPFTPGHAYGT